MRPSGTRGDQTGGFTLAELLISTAAIAVIGTVMFALLNSGIILFAKNVRLNT